MSLGQICLHLLIDIKLPYTVFPRIVYAITIILEHRVTANTKRGRILNEGEYNYVQQCNLKGHAHTCELHVFSEVSPFLQQSVRSSPTRLHRRLKLRKDRRHHRHGLLTSQQLAGKCTTLRQQQFHFA